MKKVEYKAIKKSLMTREGADDAESLYYHAEQIEKQSKILKWAAIILGVMSIPLSLLIVGIPMLVVAICMYFFGYKKIYKKAQMLREHINNDAELSAA